MIIKVFLLVEIEFYSASSLNKIIFLRRFLSLGKTKTYKCLIQRWQKPYSPRATQVW